MVRFGAVIVAGAVIASMIFAMFMYYEYLPNFIEINEGEPVVIGDVEYVITYEGQFNGDKDTRPEHTFFKIRIDAENMGREPTRISGIQFFLIDENGTRFEPVYGEFSSEDLLNFELKPGRPASYTTQFDAPFYEDKEYNIGIQPRKEQSSKDIGIVCILNCN
jgi:hypothetical protein